MTVTSNDQSTATSDQDAATTVAAAPVTVEQAAAILGVSVTTVRRRIRAGSIRAEEARRPQGPVWLVYLPADATAPTAEAPPATSSAATAPTSTPAAEAMVSLIQTTIGTILGPLVAELAASRQTVERQAEQLVAQAETIGRLTERLGSATHAESPVAGRETAPGPETALESSTRRSWASRYGLVVLAVIVVVLLMAGLTLSSGWR